MKKYLLPETGRFYKANLHCHSNLSDALWSPEKLKEEYKARGYSVLAYTDHDIFLGHKDLQDEEFLPLHGFELEVDEERNEYGARSCHMCFIALEQDNLVMPMWNRTGKYLFCSAPKHAHEVIFDENEPDYERKFSVEGISEMMQIGRKKGFFVTLNHFAWSGLTFEEYGHYEGMNAIEICNNGCKYCGGLEDYVPKDYTDILRTGKRVYCISADDNHTATDAFGGYTMIKADKLDYRTITKALEDGNFYASTGPEIYEMYVEDGYLHMKFSPAKRTIIHLGCYRSAMLDIAPEGEYITELHYKLHKHWRFFHVSIIDENGRTADTNAYYCDELME